MKTEEQTMIETIRAARTIQEFLWNHMNTEIGLEEFKRMFRKRVAKIEEIEMSNPHWRVELKKRLLQTAAIAVNLITKIDNDQLNHDDIHPTMPSNLPEYAETVIAQQSNSGVREKLLLESVQLAYRKHWMNDDSIGWSELGDTLANTLAEIMGDKDFVMWINKKRQENDA